MKPLLSIGIIFKNEIRCLERCVKSLRPLRDAIPCELVMADTGSDDGSREVAEKYADILFDFPWIDDFAAARNAVIDRCSGEWFLTVDADEWLDGDVSQLVWFLTNRDQWTHSFCGVIVRNYFQMDRDGEYNDFLGIRMMQPSAGVRYVGAIHEHWDQHGTVFGLEKTILHHDGYAEEIKEQRSKTERNMGPLREKLRRDPEDLRTLLQCVESTQGDPSHEGYIRQAAAVVERRRDLPEWGNYAASILRYAAFWAAAQHLPELERWSAEILEWFPDSIYTNIDTACALFADLAEKKEYARAIPWGERYLRSLADYRGGRFDYKELVFSTLLASGPAREDEARAILADAYFHEGQPERAREMLLSIDRSRMRPKAVENYMGVLMNLHAQGGEDLSWVMADLWEQIGRSKKREELREKVLRASSIAFSPEHRKAEAESGYAHAYTLFLPLPEACGLSAAAAILAGGSLDETARRLRAADNWEELPIVALERALLAGVEFPDRPLTVEEMDDLASRLAQSGGDLSALLDGAVRRTQSGPQFLAWADRLALAAVQSCRWADEPEDKPQEGEKDAAQTAEDAARAVERKLALARTFADLEGKLLPLCYAADVPLFLLPPLHRFGYFCARAFAALDGGDPAGYVRALRQGLESCESVKPMVEFLVDHTPQVQAPPSDPELEALAERVRTLLAACDPEDPSVAALKASPAYQRVAHLIERGDGA